MFSKSFGYALRGILYVSMMGDENRKIRIDEIAKRLSVPKHFLGKIMNKVAKENILTSTKGPNGGFYMNSKTLSTPLISLLNLTDGKEIFDSCVLRLKKCDVENPCPMHFRMRDHRQNILQLFSNTTIGDLLKEEKHNLIRSIAIA
jgi:Rrf2 family protein